VIVEEGRKEGRNVEEGRNVKGGRKNGCEGKKEDRTRTKVFLNAAWSSFSRERWTNTKSGAMHV
jgi:hypothetical protein